MGYPRHIIDYHDIKTIEQQARAQAIGSPHIIRSCLNNDFLLKHTGISFATQIRQMASNGVSMNRKVYENLRAGRTRSVNINWISYIVLFWEDNYGYEFSTLDLMSGNFIEKFEKEILPRQQAKVL